LRVDGGRCSRTKRNPEVLSSEGSSKGAAAAAAAAAPAIIRTTAPSHQMGDLLEEQRQRAVMFMLKREFMHARPMMHDLPYVVT